MKSVQKIAAAALLGMTVMMVAATTASAAIVCNGAGVCWHVRRPWAYRPEWGVVVHPNYWRPGPGIVWREHPGRGYWRNGVWITF